MRPKILLFFEYGTLNGGKFSLLSMLKSHGLEEFEFVAAAPATGMLWSRLEQCGIPIVPLRLRDAQGQKYSIAQINSHLEDLVTRLSPDLVHANSLSMGRMIGRVVQQLSIPCTSHLRDIIKLSKTAVSDLNRNAGMIAVSKATQEFHLEQGVHSDKVQVIYNGVDSDVFRFNRSTGILKEELGLSADSFLVTNIGQICLRKGQTLLAKAAVSLAEEFPEANYLFVGERYSQKKESVSYENVIRHIFHDAGMEDRLFCLGFRDDIPLLLNEIDLVVHTAHQEPLGRVLLEAAFCACAVVATKVGGTAEILSDRTSALLIPPDNINSLTDAIRRMIMDCELRNRLGRQAQKIVIKKFSISTATARIRSFWKSFL